MENSSIRKQLVFLFLIMFVMTKYVLSWTEHPLLVHPALADLAYWKQTEAVKAVFLKDFLINNELALESYLAEQEAWSRENLPNYAPRPEELAFKATGNQSDILVRFYNAIRVNPKIKVPLYLHFLPNQSTEGRPPADPKDITTLRNISGMKNTTYVWLQENEYVLPLEVLTTANDEPDYGFDLGLFEDNQTDYGLKYGFGKQPFGNPNLEYSSQAPFHMGFYHEAKILYFAGPFLKRTSLDYRIQLYKGLAQFAFENNEPYWGYRFMGWGMHYVGDVSMPYHSKPLPGVSVVKMIWINLKAMLGFPTSKNNAIQLVSNRHTVFEEFEVQVLKDAHLNKNYNHPFLFALMHPAEVIPFTDTFIRDISSAESVEVSSKVDKAIEEFMPSYMVSDPTVEANNLPEMHHLTSLIRAEKGEEAVIALTEVISERMRAFSMHIRSYLFSIIEDASINDDGSNLATKNPKHNEKI